MYNIGESYILIAALLSAVVISVLSIPQIIYVAKRKRLFDLPDNHRKVHTRIVPNLGGIGIFFSYFMVASLFIGNQYNSSWNYIATAALILFITGLRDDLVAISPGKKFIAQLAAGFVVAHFGGIQLTNLHGLFGIYELPIFISLPFTIIGITFVTNAFNLVDGVDGLAGSIGFISCAILGILLASHQNMPMAILAFSMMGAIAGFLYYNMPPANIFMGDTGSLQLGFIISVLAISFTQNYDQPISGFEIAINPQGALMLSLAAIFIPIFDTFRVFGTRILNKKSPFHPDRTHLHHYLLDGGFSHKGVTIILSCVAIFMIVFTYFLQYININIALLSMMIIGVLFVSLIVHRRKKKIQNERIIEKTTIVSKTIVIPVSKKKDIEATAN